MIPKKDPAEMTKKIPWKKQKKTRVKLGEVGNPPGEVGNPPGGKTWSILPPKPVPASRSLFLKHRETGNILIFLQKKKLPPNWGQKNSKTAHSMLRIYIYI